MTVGVSKGEAHKSLRINEDGILDRRVESLHKLAALIRNSSARGFS